jgi:hypothetical protein
MLMVLVNKYFRAWFDKRMEGGFRGSTRVGQFTLMKTVNISSSAGLGPSEIFFRAPPPPPNSQGWAAKNIYIKLERLTVTCIVTWSWSERVDLICTVDK